MGGSLRLGRLAGIDVKIHWTFLLLLAWVGGSALFNGATTTAALANVALVCFVFVCVLAHEYGHALAARRYGIPTSDITLLPIGGVARLREIPEKPSEELVVAIAGPAVNVGIALFLGFGLLMYNEALFTGALIEENTVAAGFAQNLLGINILLAVFNLLPAFPMDGGRMLRAILAMKFNRVRATDIAASVGQALAIGLGFLGLFGNPFLILIALFVYFGARAEAEHVRSTTLVQDLPVRAAMIAQVRTVREDAPLADIRDRLLEGAQQDFPVLDFDDRPTGLISRAEIVAGLQEGRHDEKIENLMRPIDGITTSPSDSLRSAMVQMQSNDLPALLVVNEETLVGLLTRENIAELIIFRETDPEFKDASKNRQPLSYHSG